MKRSRPGAHLARDCFPSHQARAAMTREADTRSADRGIILHVVVRQLIKLRISAAAPVGPEPAIPPASRYLRARRGPSWN